MSLRCQRTTCEYLYFFDFKAFMRCFNDLIVNTNPAAIYLFKVNNGNTRTECDICSELTTKTPERMFIVLHILLMFPLLTLNK